MITIEKVETKKQVKQFVSFPLLLYKNCPYYVPQFFGDEMKVFNIKNRQTKKYYLEAFLARNEAGKIVGRVAAIKHNFSNELRGEKRVRFSRLDFIDDANVCAALIKTVEDFAREHGMNAVHGPMGATDQDREGLLTEGFDRISTFALSFNYPYYKEHLEKLGYTQEAIWNEKIVWVNKIDNERFDRLSKVVLKRNRFTAVGEKSAKSLIKKYKYTAFDFVNKTYGGLYGYVPLDHADIDKLVKSFSIALKRDYMQIFLDENGEAAGFVLAMPSIAVAVQKCDGKLTPRGILGLLRAIKKPTVMEALLIGVDEKYRSTGLVAVLLNHLLKAAIKNKIVYVESNAQLLDNKEIQSVYESLNPEVVRFRAAYYKALTSN